MDTHTSSPDETRQLARELSALLKAGDVISLTGDLGAGKTCFVQGLAEALGIEEHITSPTFTILKPYKGSIPLYHFDLYRLDTLEEMTDIGLMDYLPGDGVTVLEWGDKAGTLLPAERLDIDFSYEGESDRLVRLCPKGTDWEQRVGSLKGTDE